MSIERVIETNIFRTPPDSFPVQISETPTNVTNLFGIIRLENGSEIQFMTSTGIGECPIPSGEIAQVTLGYDPVISSDENDLSVLGIWNKHRCPQCIFNPVHPKYPELVCKAALKPD